MEDTTPRLRTDQLKKAGIELPANVIPHHVAAGTDRSVAMRKDVGKQAETKRGRVLGEQFGNILVAEHINRNGNAKRLQAQTLRIYRRLR